MSSERQQILREAAHYYARRGWRVIALHSVGPDGETCSCRKGRNCNSKGKHPKNTEWQKSTRMSGADIEETWSGHNKPNVGLATGAASGFWVLDIDPKNGGMETMAALVAEHGKLPETFVVQTGSGGYHYYFKMAIGLRNTADRLGKGIDTRAEGGQVVAAPSRTDKGDYVIVKDVPLAEAPEWVLEAIRKDEVDPATITTAASLPKPEDLSDAEWERLNGYAKTAVKGNLDRLDALRKAQVPSEREATYRGEPWNHTTFQVSAALIEIANSPWCEYSIDQAYADVFKHAPRDAGFDDEVVNRTFESARTKVGDKARPVPPDRSSEPDPLFTGPDVIQGPTGGDGGSAASPVTGGAGGTEDFFDKKSLLTENFADAIMAEGRLGWGVEGLFWSYEDGVWVRDEEIVERRATYLLGNDYRNSHVENVSTFVKHRVPKIYGDPVPSLINFQNGMLRWADGDTLTPHDPDVFSTIQLPVEYDPAATCPKFDTFLGQVLHPDYVDLAWEMIGYLMMSGNPLQVAFLLFGAGGNGKGTLLRVLEALLGKRNLANESLDDLNENRFSPINLFGRLANIAGDIDGTYQEHTASFKKLTGEDVIGGEHKFGKRIQFENWAVPVFSANKFPGSADVTRGYLRRWVVIHFQRQIKDGEVITGLSDTLMDELTGIAAHGVKSLRTLMERDHFEPKGEATKGIEAMAQAIDQVRQWLSSGRVLDAPVSMEPLTRVYNAYVDWARSVNGKPLGRAEFINRLEGIGREMSTEDGILYVHGLTIVEVAPGLTSAIPTHDPSDSDDALMG